LIVVNFLKFEFNFLKKIKMDYLDFYGGLGRQLVAAGLKETWVTDFIRDYEKSGEDHYTPNRMAAMRFECLRWDDPAIVPACVERAFTDQGIEQLKKLAIDQKIPIHSAPELLMRQVCEPE